MARLYSLPMELGALRGITGDDERVRGLLLGRLGNDHFSMDHTSQAFLRVRSLLERHGDVPRWRQLLEDPVLGEDARDELAHRPIDPPRSRRECTAIVEKLDYYRKARVLFRATRSVQQSFGGESFDLDDLTDSLSEALNGARGSLSDISVHTTIIGGRHPDHAILREALTETEQEFLATGIRAFDEANQGVPRGSSWVIAATTSGGKSLLAMQVGLHQARIGGRVIYLSLEMTRKVVVRRILSHLTGVPLWKINRAHTLDRDARRQLIRAWDDFHNRVRKSGGRFRVVAPPDDMSLEEAVAMFRHHRYDNHIIDYLGLMRGMDDEDQWRKMGAGVRMCTRVASADDSIYTILCQLSAEGIIRYSKTILEHAHLAWTWTYVDDASKEARIILIRMPKTRNLRPIDLYLRENFPHMRFEDIAASEADLIQQSRRKGKKGMMGHNGGPKLEATPSSISDDRPKRPREFRQEAFSL